MREDTVKEESATIERKLLESGVECASLRWGRNEMLSKTQQAEVEVNKTLN